MTELAKNLMCISLRNGIELWLEEERASALKRILTSQDTKFIELNGEIINRADIVGLFYAQTMSNNTKRKNGDWQCSRGNWHKRKQDCFCIQEKSNYCHECLVSPCLCESSRNFAMG